MFYSLFYQWCFNFLLLCSLHIIHVLKTSFTAISPFVIDQLKKETLVVSYAKAIHDHLRKRYNDKIHRIIFPYSSIQNNSNKPESKMHYSVQQELEFIFSPTADNLSFYIRFLIKVVISLAFFILCDDKWCMIIAVHKIHLITVLFLVRVDDVFLEVLAIIMPAVVEINTVWHLVRAN